MLYEKFKGIIKLRFVQLTICQDTFVPSERDMSLFQGVALAGVASSISACITNGLDMAKLRMQVQRADNAWSGSAPKFEYNNVFHGMYSIVKNEGFMSLFKGKVNRLSLRLITV